MSAPISVNTTPRVVAVIPHTFSKRERAFTEISCDEEFESTSS
jgi:hypothetical protein